MAYATTDYKGNGSNTSFAVNFPYLDRSHVKLLMGGAELAITWLNDQLISTSGAPPANEPVQVRRVTPIAAPAVAFQDASTLTDSDLNRNSLQALYGLQERADRHAEAWAAISKEVADRANAANIEAAARANADAQEQAERAAADIALGKRIDSIVLSNLPEGSITRPKLGTDVKGELDGLRSDLSAEITARGSAVTSEATARKAGDDALTASLASEKTDRKSADDSLNAALGTETAARKSADSTLDGRVTTLEGRPATPADGSIGTAKLADKGVTMAKLADDVAAKVNNAGFDAPTVSKAINFREKQFKLLDYGAYADQADATSKSANKAAFDKAFADMNNSAGGGLIRLPVGITYMNGNLGGIVQVGGGVIGDGIKSRLHFTGFTAAAAPLLRFNAVSGGNGDIPVSLRGFDIRMDNVASMSGNPVAEIRGGGYLGWPKVNDVDFVCHDATSSPQNFLHIINPVEINVDRVTITSFNTDANGFGLASTGIRFDADVVATDSSCSAVRMVGVANGFVVVGSQGGGPNLEAMSYTDCVLVQVKTGVLHSGNSYRNPGQSWKGGHINARVACFYLTKWAQFDISGGQFYLDGHGTEQQAAIVIVDSESIRIHDNYFAYALTGGPSPTTTLVNIANDTSGNIQIHHNQFLILTNASTNCIFSGASGKVWVDHNKRFGSSGSIIGGTVTDEGFNSSV